MSMTLLEIVVKPTVAGDSDGAGAVEVEFERDVTDRDLSRKSTSAYIYCVNDA